MIESAPPYKVEPMQWTDVPEVMAIEQQAFNLPWSDYTYRHEILENTHSYYFVARRLDGEAPRPASRLMRLVRRTRKAPIVGYGGFWLVTDESHISTIASDTKWRGRGIGELMLLAMVERSIELNAAMVTLEVRVSNLVAQNLYRKYGFEIVGRRARYYRDTNEDAELMTVEHIDTVTYQQRLRELRAALEDRLRREVMRTA